MSDSQPERLRGREEVERISELLRRFIEHLRSHDRSERTIKSYSSDLKLFAKWFHDNNREELTPQSITPIDVREYSGSPEPLAPESLCPFLFPERSNQTANIEI